MNGEYKRWGFSAKVYGTVSGVLYDGREAYRDFQRTVGPKHPLEKVIREECSKDFDGGGKVTEGWLEVTYYKGATRRVVRDFTLSLFPSISKYAEF